MPKVELTIIRDNPSAPAIEVVQDVELNAAECSEALRHTINGTEFFRFGNAVVAKECVQVFLFKDVE